MLLDAVLQRRNKVDPVMRIVLTVLTFLFGAVAHAAHLAPWNPDGDGMRVGMSANGGGVAARDWLGTSGCSTRRHPNYFML